MSVPGAVETPYPAPRAQARRSGRNGALTQKDIFDRQACAFRGDYEAIVAGQVRLPATNSSHAQLELVKATLLPVIFATVRNVFEPNMPLALQADIRSQLMARCLSYLEGAGG